MNCRVKQLDDWQIEVVNYIKRGESVVILPLNRKRYRIECRYST